MTTNLNQNPVNIVYWLLVLLTVFILVSLLKPLAIIIVIYIAAGYAIAYFKGKIKNVSFSDIIRWPMTLL